MTDIITRLHTAVITEVNPIDGLTYPTNLGMEAAEEIERLREDILNTSDGEAYEYFARRYLAAHRTGDHFMARVLSGRLRDLDKRTRKANARADAAETEIERLRGALRETKFAIFSSDMTIKDRADQAIRLALK